MDSKQLKQALENLGFGIAHVRCVPRKTELRAYVAVKNDEHPLVDEIRYNDGCEVTCIQHAIKPNGYTQYDKFLYFLPLRKS